MSESTTEPVVQTSVDEPTPAAPATDAAPADGETALGDAGKKALDAMKAERKTARDQAAAEKARADALQAKLDGKEAEHAAELKSEQAALAKYNDRILKSEVKAAATGVLADPADAYKFLDLSKFEVDDDGNVDESAIAKSLADLVKNKPYLAAQGGTRFQGTADGGARNDAAKLSQLSKADVDRMTPGEINKARREGRLDDLLRK
jgi:hypothetical protein